MIFVSLGYDMIHNKIMIIIIMIIINKYNTVQYNSYNPISDNSV